MIHDCNELYYYYQWLYLEIEKKISSVMPVIYKNQFNIFSLNIKNN